MSPYPRDSQRSKLYAAERAAGVVRSVADPEYREIGACSKYLNGILQTKWIAKHHPESAGSRVNVGPGRGSRCPFARGWSEIQLPRWGRSKGVMLHELAHILTTRKYRGGSKVAHHGREYAAIYVALVQRFMGREAADRLRAEFRDHGVRYTPRRTVTMSPERRAALASRMRELRAATRHGS